MKLKRKKFILILCLISVTAFSSNLLNWKDVGILTWWEGQNGEGFKIIVQLPMNRDTPGEMWVVNKQGLIIYGPVPVLGASSYNIAKNNNNSSRDNLKPFGNTPTGHYIGTVKSSFSLRPNGKTYASTLTKSGLLSFGREGIILLDPIDGEALQAKNNGRSGLLIHSGSVSSHGKLRPTAGCLRMLPIHMSEISSIINNLIEVPISVENIDVFVKESRLPILIDDKDEDDFSHHFDESLFKDYEGDETMGDVYWGNYFKGAGSQEILTIKTKRDAYREGAEIFPATDNYDTHKLFFEEARKKVKKYDLYDFDEYDPAHQRDWLYKTHEYYENPYQTEDEKLSSRFPDPYGEEAMRSDGASYSTSNPSKSSGRYGREGRGHDHADGGGYGRGRDEMGAGNGGRIIFSEEEGFHYNQEFPDN